MHQENHLECILNRIKITILKMKQKLPEKKAILNKMHLLQEVKCKDRNLSQNYSKKKKFLNQNYNNKINLKYLFINNLNLIFYLFKKFTVKIEIKDESPSPGKKSFFDYFKRGKNSS